MIDLEEHRPHFCIIGPKNEVHVVPVVVIEKMAYGSLPLFVEEQKEIDSDMIRGIIREWLEVVHGKVQNK